MKYIPAILAITENELLNQYKKILPRFSHVSIDFVDGVLFPNTTVSIKQVSEVIKQSEETYHKKITVHFDLMVQDYQAYIEEIKQSEITIGSIVVNTKSGITNDYITSQQQFFRLGISAPIEMSIDTIKSIYNLEALPIIQIMSIDAGFQGNAFNPLSLIKVEQLRLHNYKNKIVLDGGVNPTSLPLIQSKEYKPDVIIVGSYFTKAIDIKQSLTYFSEQNISPYTGD